MRRYTYKEVKEAFEAENYKLLSTDYKNCRTKLTYECPNGHVYSITFDGWLKGRRCYFCRANIKLSTKYVREALKAEGYTLLSEYKNSRTKFKYRCPNGHIGYIKWDHWRDGHRCAACAGNKNKVLADIQEEFENEGYELLSTSYKNSHSLLRYKCPKGHIGNILYYNWKVGHRCAQCAGNVKLSLDTIKDQIEAENYKLISNFYENNKQKLELVCPNGHEYHVSWSEWNSGSRCPRCNLKGISKQELEFEDFIKSLDVKYYKHDRQLIKPYELDFVLPDYKLAIEYCGLYWHSELMGKDKRYHLNKLDRCLKHGYNLITIFEDEWIFKRDIVKSILLYKLKFKDFLHKIYARDCVVKEINSKLAANFCEANHLQGYHGASIKLGLFYDDKLVSVMTFAKPSISKGNKSINAYNWELSRFCVLINHFIIGGASKLLKFFENNYIWRQIISYADRRWSIGHLYLNLGFKEKSRTPPNYWYFNKQRRIHRFVLRKTKNDIEKYNEWQNRLLDGWNRIWDCGNIKYCKFNEE